MGASEADRFYESKECEWTVIAATDLMSVLFARLRKDVYVRLCIVGEMAERVRVRWGGLELVVVLCFCIFALFFLLSFRSFWSWFVRVDLLCWVWFCVWYCLKWNGLD